MGVLVAQWLGRRIYDLTVVGSTPRRDVIMAPRSTQPHPSGVGISSTGLTGWG